MENHPARAPLTLPQRLPQARWLMQKDVLTLSSPGVGGETTQASSAVIHGLNVVWVILLIPPSHPKCQVDPPLDHIPEADGM